MVFKVDVNAKEYLSKIGKKISSIEEAIEKFPLVVIHNDGREFIKVFYNVRGYYEVELSNTCKGTVPIGRYSGLIKKLTQKDNVKITQRNIDNNEVYSVKPEFLEEVNNHYYEDWRCYKENLIEGTRAEKELEMLANPLS